MHDEQRWQCNPASSAGRAPKSLIFALQVVSILAYPWPLVHQVLLDLQPTLIVTQSLCAVCSIDLVVVERLVARWPGPKPTIVSLNPQSLQDVIGDVLRVGEAAGTLAHAQAAVSALQTKLQAITAQAAELGPAKLQKASDRTAMHSLLLQPFICMSTTLHA